MKKAKFFSKVLAVGMALSLGVTLVNFNPVTVSAEDEIGFNMNYIYDTFTAPSTGYEVPLLQPTMILTGGVLDLTAISAADFPNVVVNNGIFANTGLIRFDAGVADEDIMNLGIINVGVFESVGASSSTYWRQDLETGSKIVMDSISSDLVFASTDTNVTGDGYTWVYDAESDVYVLTLSNVVVKGDIVFPQDKEVVINVEDMAYVDGQIQYESLSSAFQLQVTGGGIFLYTGSIEGSQDTDYLYVDGGTVFAIGGVVCISDEDTDIGGTVTIVGDGTTLSIVGNADNYALITESLILDGAASLETMNTIALLGRPGYGLTMGEEASITVELIFDASKYAMIAIQEDAFDNVLNFFSEDTELVDEYDFYTLASKSTGEVLTTVEFTSHEAPLVEGYGNVSVAEGKDAYFGVDVYSDDDDENIVYQWQVFDGDTWSDIDGATDYELLLEAVDGDMDGLIFRCVVTDSYGTTTSDEMTLTVTGASDDVTTGDHNNMNLWMGILVAAGVVVVGAGALVFFKRKKA